MIQLKNISKIYTNSKEQFIALDNISLNFEDGLIHGVIGESGAGKSTLLRCINKLETPNSGNLFIGETDILSLNSQELRNFRRKIGMIFQNFNLFEAKTVYDNVAFPLKLAGLSNKEITEKVSNLLTLVNMAPKKDSYPSQLSGGQKQRVAIARALANDPELLLCDEATSALDPATTDQILKLLKDINSKLNLTIILITHEMDVVKEICDTVTHMENGNISYTGPTLKFYSNFRRDTFLESYNVNKNSWDFEPGRVIHISFTDENVKEPIISTISKRLDIDVNIIAGSIDQVGNRKIGNMIIQVPNSSIQGCTEILYELKTHMEVLN